MTIEATLRRVFGKGVRAQVVEALLAAGSLTRGQLVTRTGHSATQVDGALAALAKAGMVMRRSNTYGLVGRQVWLDLAKGRRL